ncbi:MAG: hypothetical protein B0A82_11165, partial [Alkalinema sp. CACIAM 70d]
MAGSPAEFVAGVVWARVIDRWEGQDLPPHLKTIRDRLLRRGEERMGRLLGVYQQVLAAGEEGIAADESEEQLELRLTGLVVRREGRLRLYNRIYGAVFDGGWVDRALGELRPYGAAIAAWLASAGRDESRLLRGRALQDARGWAEGKRLGDDDYRFLDASQELERREMQTLLAAEQEANQILTTAREQAETELAEANQELAGVNRRAKRQATVGGAVLAASLLVAGLAGVGAMTAGRDRDSARQEVQNSQQEKSKLETEKLTLDQKLQSTQQKEKQAQQKVTLAQKQFQQAQQNLVTAKRNVEAANQQMQGALAAAQAAQQKEQQANQQLAGANQKIAAADARLQNAQQQATKAQQQADAAATVAKDAGQKTEFANQMLEAVGIQVDGAKAQARVVAGQELLGLVQGIRAAGKYQQLSAKLKGTNQQPTPEWMEAKLQTQAVLTNVYGIQERNSVKSNQGSVRSVNFSPDGKTIVSGGYDGT